MGVVRREGHWRLEKETSGLYEVTHEGRTEAIITTPEYDPGMFDDRMTFGVPTYEADSAAEARAVFEDIVESNSASILPDVGPTDSGTELSYGSGLSDASQSSELDIGDLPPGGIAFVMTLAGGVMLFSSSVGVGSPAFFLAAALLLGGVGIFGWALAIFNSEGPAAAWTFLITVEADEEFESESTAGDDEDEVERTPPAPQKLTDDLYFDRANQCCDWCDEPTDHPEVHHITPRSEGGPNEPSNLIVLCPEHHRKADCGGISQTKLRAKVRRQAESET